MKHLPIDNSEYGLPEISLFLLVSNEGTDLFISRSLFSVLTKLLSFTEEDSNDGPVGNLWLSLLDLVATKSVEPTFDENAVPYLKVHEMETAENAANL